MPDVQKIDFTPLPILSTNYIWILSHPTLDEAYVVDPGDAEPVLHFLSRRKLKLKGVLITHSHNDHIGGLKALLNTHSVPVIGPACERIPLVDHPVGEGDTFELWADCSARVMHLPGHLPEHIAFSLEGSLLHAPSLMCGDVIFSSGCGRIFTGTPKELKTSLDRIAALPSKTRLYSSHEYTETNIAFALELEPNNEMLEEKRIRVAKMLLDSECSLPTNVATEKSTNPFLRCSEPELIASLKTKFDREPRNELETFTWLRKLKDQY